MQVLFSSNPSASNNTRRIASFDSKSCTESISSSGQGRNNYHQTLVQAAFNFQINDHRELLQSFPSVTKKKAKCFCLFLVCHTNHSRLEKSSHQTPINVNKSSFEVFQINHNRILLQPFFSVFNKRPAALKFETSSENWRFQKSCHQIANKLEHK